MEARKKDKLVLNIKRCIESTFNESKWEELGYLTGGQSIINGHERLLRSFRFGDDDYGSRVFEVVEDLIALDAANQQIISDYIGLQEWMQRNFPRDYEQLYGHTHPLLLATEEIAVVNSFELHQYISRIRQAIESDPELAVGSTKEMLESVLKVILGGKDENKEDLPALLKKAQKALNLSPNDVDLDSRGSDTVKRTLSNLGQIVLGIDELRNLYGTGHGKAHKTSLSPRHARLVVGAGATLATFLMETYEFQKKKQNSPE